MTAKPPSSPDGPDTISLPFIFVPDGTPMPDVSRIFRDPIILRARFEPEENAANPAASRLVVGQTHRDDPAGPPPSLLAAGPKRESNQARSPQSLPSRGQASTYADHFNTKRTASGREYYHTGYSAALLPRSRRNAVPWGTRLQLTYHGRSVVVEVNDWGSGNGKQDRVLDLSRAAMAFLMGVTIDKITDSTAGVIQLERIEIVPSDTPLGPWIPAR